MPVCNTVSIIDLDVCVRVCVAVCLRRSFVGFIVNETRRVVRFLPASHHWFAIRAIDGVFFDFNSLHEAPLAMDGVDAVHDRLDKVRASDGHIFVVRRLVPATDDRD